MLGRIFPAVLLLVAALRAQRMAYMFVGNNITNTTNASQVNASNAIYGQKVYLYPDFTYDEIIISSSSLNCTEAIGCSVSGEPKTMTFLNKTFQYVDGRVQLNFIKQPLADRAAFRYVVGDTQNVTSVLGLAQNSTFLNYYYSQNKKLGAYQTFVMNYENEINFIQVISDKTGLRPNPSLNAKIYYNVTSSKWGKNGTSVASLPTTAKICISNRVDMDPSSSSIMAVRESAYPMWLEFINDINRDLTDSTDTLARNITMSVFDPEARQIGDIIFYMDEFVDSNRVVLVKPFTSEFDQGRGCDIYTGKLLLKKYKFQYYYMEQASGYETKFAYDLHAMNKTNVTTTTAGSSGSGFWWKLLLFVIIVGVIGYFAYRYFVGSGESQERFDDENYRSFPPAQNMVEMRDVSPTDAALRRPVPTPADDNERIPNLMGK